MRNWFILILLCGLSLTGAAQTVITGHVTDDNGEAVDNAIVKLLDGDKMCGYAMSKADGYYVAKTKCAATTLTLVVERLSYARYSVTIANRSSQVEVVLQPKATELREVTVKAPSVYVRGDTLTFRLDAFKGKEDITLKDAMKKIPGIQIADNGTISYQGKPIKHFYIEGLDLLDGKYNLATDNIPADYVQAVQVLNNHNDSKVDKDRFSDDVAINIKLEPWAKFKPMGNYEASAGWGDRALYRLGGAAMMFNKSFQTILTAKISNVEEFATDAVRVLASRFGSDKNNLLDMTLNRLSGSAPPISKTRYQYPDDKLLTLNLLNKLSDDTQLRTQASYSYNKASYGYSSVERYYDGANQVIIDQSLLSETRTHSPELTSEYRINADNKDLTNRFAAKASFLDASLPVSRQMDEISQDETMKAFSLSDVFSIYWKRGTWRWAVNSNFLYNGGPEGRIDIRRHTATDPAIVQRARTSQFYTAHSISTTYNYKNFFFSIPAGVKVSSERIKTYLDHDIAGYASNIITGTDVIISATPKVSYEHKRKVVSLHGTLGLQAESYDYINRGSEPCVQKATKLSANPSFYLTWNVDARSTFSVRSSYNHGIGDIIDMLTATMATNYMGLNARSGIISDNSVFSSALDYRFQMPVEMFFVNASVNHTRTRYNLLSAQSVDDDVIGAYTIDRPAHSQSTGAMAKITKQFETIKTQISLSGSYGAGSHEIFQNDEVIPYKNRSLSIEPSLNTNPFAFVGLTYRVSFSKTYTSFTDVRRSYINQTHFGKLNIFPVKGLNIGISNEMSWHELAPGVTKFLSLLDANASYTIKSWRIGLSFNNLLNRKHYAYTIFSALNNFTYDYRLRPREILLSVTFTK